jgi:uncharacterized protein (TIGR02594 family)
MSALPPEYRWIEKIDGPPRLIVEALALYGTKEMQGDGDNPVIIQWAREIGGAVAQNYKHDSTAWCGLFMALVATRAKKQIPDSPLWALSWAKFGNEAPSPRFGDVLTFKREGGGHVGLYVAEDEGIPKKRGPAFHVLGGNQGDQVCITRIEKTRLYAARRSIWQIEQPYSVIPHIVAATGMLSTNEA